MKATDVQWRTLRTATGTADGMPAAISSLFSEEPEVRRASYWRIDNHAILQGDLFDSAPFVVAEVIDGLARHQRNSEDAYSLLVEMANGSAPEQNVVHFDGLVMPLVEATQRALSKGLAYYWRDLGSDDVKVRRHVSELLLALEELGPDAAKRVQRALATERDERVRKSLEELSSSKGWQ
jgi:hypothetical protein